MDLYRPESPAVRLHTAVRWRSCPFEAVAAAVPPTGRILEVGCGHGLFSAFLALTEPGRVVHGIDVDGAKLAVARRAAGRSGCRLTFGPADATAFPPGPWDAVVIIDVLYLLDPRRQEALLRTAAEALAPGGTLAVKEMAESPAWKFAWMRLQEHVAVRVLRITAGDTLSFVPPRETAGWLAQAGLAVETQALDRGYPHPHHLLVGRRPV